jgi:hypothetical protein
MDRLPITEAALRLRMSYHKVRELVLTGKLGGGRDEAGRLYASATAVEQLRADTRASKASPVRARGEGAS